VAIGWGFGAALVITILPIMESSEEIGKIFTGMMNVVSGKPAQPLKTEVR